jgi:hypothetical protein
VTLPGAPALPRCPLGREPSPANAADLEAMRRRVWREQGVVSLSVEDITDPWLRQAVVNEATRRWGPRTGGPSHGR